MGKKRMHLKRICAMLFYLSILAWAGVPVPAAASQDSAPTVIYQDSLDYTCWDNAFFADGGVWSKEMPQFGNNGFFTSQTPLVEDGVMKLSEGMSAQFNWTRLSEQVSFDSANTYTLTFEITIKDFGDDQPMDCNQYWKREFYFAAAGWYNQIELQSDHAVGCIRTGNVPDKQSVEARAGTKGVDYLLNIPYTAQMIWEPATGTITTIVKQGDTVISTGARTNTTAFTHADDYCSNWVFRCEDGEVWVDNIRFTDGIDLYTQTFESDDSASCMASSGAWSLETFRVEPDSKAPELAEGVVKLTTGTSIQFDWYNLMERTYDPDQTYTFAFDFKLTDEGSGATWGGPYMTRALYVGSGGWYNHIELLCTTQPYTSVRAGDSYMPYEQSLYLNQTIHAKLVWKGNTITTTLCDADGNLLLTGYRINTSFTNMSVEHSAMTSLALRCEDGAVEIDNFTFSIGGTDENAVELLDTRQLDIAEDQQGVFTCNIDYTAEDRPSLRLGDTELFSLNGDSLWFCGCQVAGSYPAGTYGLQITVNPVQKMISVEVTLPDGGTVRRGTCDQVEGSQYTLNLYGQDKEVFSDISLSYADITTNAYTLNTAEPVSTGFQANVYNLVSSFDDARSTRNFAWTALREYIGEDSMAVRYRLSGTEDWTTVEAQVEAGSFINPTEVYLKADITGLDADATYQYQIGKPGSTESSDWSEIYTFTTAPGRTDAFSFVALGDTQGNSWADYRPLMLTQAAYAEALEAAPNAAFVLHTGDIVENGTVADMWNRYFKALGSYGATIPHLAAIGNHDAIQVSSEFYYDLHFNHPNNGGTSKLDTVYTSQLPSGSDLAALAQRADETFYSFNYGDVHFVVLNSGNYTPWDQYILEAQRAWLISDLQANAHAKWTVVTVHEPVYHRRGGNESRPWLYDVIEGYGVDLVIQGHSHLVTRSYPMKDGSIVTKESPDAIVRGSGTVYTTVGSTTTNHDSMGNPNMEEMMLIKTPASEQAAYTCVTVTDTQLTMTVRQLDGLVLDQFTITGPSPDTGHSYTAAVTEPTCQTGGYTTYTCLCGDVYVADKMPTIGHSYVEGSCSVCGAEDPDYVPMWNISFANMTLGNSLAMNFALRQDVRDDWNGCYAKIVKTYADGRGNKEIIIPYADWGMADIDGAPYFTLKFDGVAAKEMSDIVYVTIYDAEGNAISNTWEDSVRDYAMRTLNNPETSRECAIMVVDLLNYGAAAQEYFGYNEDDLANSEMTAEQKALSTTDAPAEDIRVKSGNYRGTNLGLESQILMRMAFAQAPEDAYATIAFTNHSGREITVNVASHEIMAEKGSSIITIDEIVVADGRKPVTVTIYNPNGTVFASVTDSMESYIARMGNTDTIYEMILRFSDSAYHYFH